MEICIRDENEFVSLIISYNNKTKRLLDTIASYNGEGSHQKKTAYFEDVVLIRETTYQPSLIRT